MEESENKNSKPQSQFATFSPAASSRSDKRHPLRAGRPGIREKTLTLLIRPLSWITILPERWSSCPNALFCKPNALIIILLLQKEASTNDFLELLNVTYIGRPECQQEKSFIPFRLALSTDQRTMLLDNSQESDDDFRRRTDKHLTLSTLLGVDNVIKTIGED